MRKLSAVLLILTLLLSLSATATAQSPVVQHTYSSEANSGIRHEVCTTLNGTGVDTYYTGDYTIDRLSIQTGDTLLQTLRTLMTTTHTHYTTYGDCRDYAVKTDCENGDGVTINLLYSSFVTNWQGYTNNTKGGWNREHVWPISLGGFSKEQTPGCDLHHIRPTDGSLNGTRGNDKYGVVIGGKEMYGTSVTNNAHGGKKGGGYMEPLDNVKGDVARICLYMYVRYGSEYSGCKSITNVFQSVDVLLQWHEMDPVDTWEMGRNEVVYAIQGNRNVFIDYPEFAWQLFNREIPENAITPSNSSAFAPCQHPTTEIRNAKAATCIAEGYTGDTVCADCGKLISAGTATALRDAHTYGQWVRVDGASNLQARSCIDCGFQEARTIPSESPNDGQWLWIALIVAVVAVAGVTAVLVIKKKKQ